MRYSTKCRYALRLMMELALQPAGESVSLNEISQRQQISLKYLQQIVIPLTKAGLVSSVRGSQGGYYLTKAPRQYTTGEIFRAVEGSLAPIPCLEVDDCPRRDGCRSRQFWAGLEQTVNTYLDGVTLADLLQQPGQL